MLARAALAAALAALAPTGLAQPLGEDHGHSVDAELHGQLVEAEVVDVNRKTGEVTLKHADIAALAMPPMTMSFQVLDPAMLVGLKPGDRVRFSADWLGGVLTVIRLEAAK